MDEDGATDPGSGNMLIYRDASTSLQVRLDGATVWLSQRQIAELYQTTPQNVTQHVAHIYEEGELGEAATCKDFLQVQTEGTSAIGSSSTRWKARSPAATSIMSCER